MSTINIYCKQFRPTRDNTDDCGEPGQVGNPCRGARCPWAVGSVSPTGAVDPVGPIRSAQEVRKAR